MVGSWQVWCDELDNKIVIFAIEIALLIPLPIDSCSKTES